VRDSLLKSLQNSMMITANVEGEVSLDTKFSYNGIGSVQVHNLSKELDVYVTETLRDGYDDFFSREDVALVDRLVTAAKQRIREDFPTDRRTNGKRGRTF
jgi:negative regulator of genetic competence, sporulation and motility